MINTKTLRPSLREKKRYIVFEILSDRNFSLEEAKQSVIRSCIRCLGEFGCAKANIYFVKTEYMDNRGIIRVSNRMVNDVRASMLLIKEINGERVTFHTLGISGILKKARNKFLIKK